MCREGGEFVSVCREGGEFVNVCREGEEFVSVCREGGWRGSVWRVQRRGEGIALCAK